MSSRVWGALLALTAAALLAVPMVTSVVIDAGGWWSGHPTVKMQNGEHRSISAKDVYVGFFSATGCNTGGDQKCEGLTDKLPTSFAIAALVEAALTGVAAIVALGLGITTLQGTDGRKILAKLMGAALAASVIGGLVLTLLGPTFKGNDVQIPFAWGQLWPPIPGGFLLFLGGVAFGGLASVLAVREPRVRVPKIKPIKPPKAVQVRPAKPAKQPKQPKPPKHKPVPMPPPPVQEPFDVQNIFAQDGVAPHGGQPLFEQAPQLRPLYEAHGEMFPGAVPQQSLPMRPPTPISREELGAMMGGDHANPAAAIVEQRNAKPPTIPPAIPRKSTTNPPFAPPPPPYQGSPSQPYPQYGSQPSPYPPAQYGGSPSQPALFPQGSPNASYPPLPPNAASSHPSIPPGIVSSHPSLPPTPPGSGSHPSIPPPLPSNAPPSSIPQNAFGEISSASHGALPPQPPPPTTGFEPIATPFAATMPAPSVPAIVAGAATMPPGSMVAGELPGLPPVASSMSPTSASSLGDGVPMPVADAPRSKPATLPPPKIPPTLGNGPRPQVPMPRPTAIGTVPAAARTSGTIPPAIGKATPPRSHATIGAAVVPPVPAIPAPPTFVKPERSETESEDFDSATAQNRSPGESTDATGKPFETEEPVGTLEANDDYEEARTVRAPSTKIAKAMDDMHEAVTRRAPPGVSPDDIHEAVTVRKPKVPRPESDGKPRLAGARSTAEGGAEDDDEAKTVRAPSSKERASARELGLSTGDATIQLEKEDPVHSSAPLPGTVPPESVVVEAEPEPQIPAPPVIVPTLTSMARALRQKRSAERQRERTETNLKAVAAGAAPDTDAPIAPPSRVPITTAPSTLPPPVVTQTMAAGPQPACPQCESPMAWVEEHLRFYCKACRMYF